MKITIKSLIMIFLSICVVLNFGNIALAKEQTFTMDGKKVKLSTTKILFDGVYLNPDVPPVILSGTTLVPVRIISETMGADIAWDSKNNNVTIKKSNKTIVLKINSTKVTVDGKSKSLPNNIPAKLINDRTMVPIRFVSEEMGLEVSWDESANVVVVNTPKIPINTSVDFNSYIKDEKESFVIKRDVKTEYKSFYLDSPSRLVFDISNANIKNNLESKEDNIGQYYIKSYKSYFYENEGRTRVTITFKDGIDKKNIKISDDSNNIVVLFDFENVNNNNNSNNNNNNSNNNNSDNNNSNSNDNNSNTNDNNSSNNGDSNNDVIKNELSDTSSPNRPGEKYLIAIDPGHGGSDPGAVSPIDKTREKDLNLSIAKKLDEKLKENGYDTLMTRDSDVYPENKSRAVTSNNNRADIYVSIHINSATSSQASGIETLFYPNKGEFTKDRDCQSLAKSVHDEVMKSTGAVNRKIIERPNLIVLKYTDMPAIMVECGFLTNANELERLKSDEYQYKIVEGIVNGINNHLRK